MTTARLSQTLAAITVVAASFAAITPSPAFATEESPATSPSWGDSTDHSALTPLITPVPDDNQPTDEGLSIVPTAGGQQGILTIDSPQDRHIRTFDLGLSSEATIREINGFFFIVDKGTPVIRISAPWAADRHGNPVHTWFTTDGKTLTQHIEQVPEENYPLTADPRWTWGNISGHVYFSKEETRKLAAGSAGAAAVGPFWMAVPQPFGLAITTWWEKNSIQLTETATRAVAGDKCVELKVGWVGVTGGAIGISPAEYTEGCA